MAIVLDGTVLGLGVHLARSAAGARAWGVWGVAVAVCFVTHAALRRSARMTSKQ
jgi:hypothetical protein